MGNGREDKEEKEIVGSYMTEERFYQKRKFASNLIPLPSEGCTRFTATLIAKGTLVSLKIVLEMQHNERKRHRL